MNKFLIYPLIVLVIISFISFAYNAVVGVSDPQIVHFNDTVYKTNWQDLTIDIGGMVGIFTIVFGAIAFGVLSGVSVLGTGLSTQAQRIVFLGTIFIGLWASLSVISLNFIFSGAHFVILYGFITIIYVIGLGTELGGSSA